MPKVKNKIKNWRVAVNILQLKMLEELMKEDGQTDVSSYFGILISEVYKSRQESKNKRPVGRPKKDDYEDEEEDDPEVKYKHDLPKKYLHYGRRIGEQEMQDIKDLQSQFKPK